MNLVQYVSLRGLDAHTSPKDIRTMKNALLATTLPFLRKPWFNGWIAYLKKTKTGINEPGANHAVQELQAPYPTESHTEKD